MRAVYAAHLKRKKKEERDAGTTELNSETRRRKSGPARKKREKTGLPGKPKRCGRYVGAREQTGEKRASPIEVMEKGGILGSPGTGTSNFIHEDEFID